jgi:hypothetical protein
MGYWNTARDGTSFSDKDGDLLWGDHPADLMSDALDAIAKAFAEQVERPVTLAELRAGLEFALMGKPDEVLYDDLHKS